MARALWLGYNVLLMDTDSFIYHEPYKYLKAPPLSTIRCAGWVLGGSGRGCVGGAGGWRAAGGARVAACDLQLGCVPLPGAVGQWPTLGLTTAPLPWPAPCPTP